jgi:5'-deoxynucleotidase YfbR-like HD superfamily hydrolase
MDISPNKTIFTLIGRLKPYYCCMKPSINRFGALAGLVKKVKRTGWLRYLPEHQVESVGDHSAKIAFLSLYLRNVENVDYVKCVQMALIHDIA